VRREDVHIYVSSLLKHKMSLHVSVGKYLYCTIVEFEV
jgi:hypothetical protein